MSKKRTLFLLRHGKTGLSGRYIGSKDVPLSPEGISQIENLKVVFQKNRIDTIYTSPMLRCRQTCKILFPDVAVFCDDHLKEIDFGRWEGLTFDEISAQDAGIVNEWAINLSGFTFPEGESVAQFNSRVQKFAVELTAKKDKNILVVCHGGVVRSLLCYFLGMDLQNYLVFQVQKGRYSTVDLFGAKGVLTGFNLH